MRIYHYHMKNEWPWWHILFLWHKQTKCISHHLVKYKYVNLISYVYIKFIQKKGIEILYQLTVIVRSLFCLILSPTSCLSVLFVSVSSNGNRLFCLVWLLLSKSNEKVLLNDDDVEDCRCNNEGFPSTDSWLLAKICKAVS